MINLSRNQQDMESSGSGHVCFQTDYPVEEVLSSGGGTKCLQQGLEQVGYVNPPWKLISSCANPNVEVNCGIPHRYSTSQSFQ